MNFHGGGKCHPLYSSWERWTLQHVLYKSWERFAAASKTTTILYLHHCWHLCKRYSRTIVTWIISSKCYSVLQQLFCWSAIMIKFCIFLYTNYSELSLGFGLENVSGVFFCKFENDYLTWASLKSIIISCRYWILQLPSRVRRG